MLIASGDQCADITFRDAPAQPGSCTNGTGITTRPVEGEVKNANETKVEGHGHGGGESGSASATGSASAAGASPTGAATRKGLGWAAASVMLGVFGYAMVV